MLASISEVAAFFDDRCSRTSILNLILLNSGWRIEFRFPIVFFHRLSLFSSTPLGIILESIAVLPDEGFLTDFAEVFFLFWLDVKARILHQDWSYVLEVLHDCIRFRLSSKMHLWVEFAALPSSFAHSCHFLLSWFFFEKTIDKRWILVLFLEFAF